MQPQLLPATARFLSHTAHAFTPPVMARKSTSDHFLSALLTNEALADSELAGFIEEEMRCGLSEKDRKRLAAAMEGICAIPEMHRETIIPPLGAGRLLCHEALYALHYWWDDARRARMNKQVAACDSLSRLLYTWCSWRATERHKRRQEAAGKVRYADGRPADITALKAA